MPGELKQAIADKDIQTIRRSVKTLNMSGPSNVEGARDACRMLKRYDSQARAVREAITARNVEAIRAALANWEFPEDANTDEGHSTIQRREEQLQQLEVLVASERVNGNQLIAAVTTWEFESDNEHFRHAVQVLHGFRMEADALADIMRQEPVSLLQLRIAVDSWSFASDPESCDALHDAVLLLRRYEEEVRAAVTASDGYALQELLDGGAGQALGNEELMAEAQALQTRHSEVSGHLLRLVRGAANLEASAKEDIEEKCESWDLAKSDPVFELGRTWLRLHAIAAQNSSEELEIAARSGFETVALRSLERQQALESTDSHLAAAQQVVCAAGQAWQAAGALAFGVAPSRLPDGDNARTLEAMTLELRRAEAARNSCTSDLLREVKQLSHAPEGVHECFQVVQALLTGSSSWKAPKDDSSWKSCQDLLGARFVDHLGEVPTFISTARREGIMKAKALDAKMRSGPMASTWSEEGMGRLSMLCKHLFVYLQHIFRYDELLTATFASAPQHSAQHPPAGCEASWKAFQASLQKGLPESGQLAALFATCSCEAADSAILQSCEDRGTALVEAARQRMLKLQEQLEDLSPLEGLGRASANNEGRGDQPRTLTLELCEKSGAFLGKIDVSDAATGTQLKCLIAGQAQFDAPKSSEQRLLNGDAIVRDHTTLARQSIRNGSTLTLVPVEVSLHRRLEQLISSIRSLDPSSLSGPAAKHLLKAASYFSCDGYPQKRTEAVLKTFVDFLKDAILFVQAVGKGMSLQQSCMSVCERKIQVHMFEYGELPAYHFATVLYHLTGFVQCAGEEAAAIVSELTTVMRKLFEEFVPKFFSWASSLQALEESERTCSLATEAARMGMWRQGGRKGGILSLEPSAVFEQLESLSAAGIVAAAPHIEALSDAAASDVQELLESEDIAHLGKRARHVERLLAAHLAPVLRVTDTLSRLSKLLVPPGAIPQDVTYLTPVYQLVIAVSRIFGKPGEADITFTKAKRLLEQPGLLASRLETWRPLRDGSVQQLRSAETILLGLWGTARAGAWHPQPEHDERHRILFAWAALAVSLAPLLSAALALAPAHATVKAAADGMKRRAEETSVAVAEEHAWKQVREALRVLRCEPPVSKEEPWLWLQLIGCTDPKAYYTQHQFFIEAPKATAVASSGYPAGSSSEDAKAKKNAAPPQSQRPPNAGAEPREKVAHLAAAKSNTYDSMASEGTFDEGTFDEDSDEARTPPKRQQSAQDSEGGQDFDDYEEEKDPYSDVFDAAPASPVSQGGGAYSQDEFDFDYDRSPATAKASPSFEKQCSQNYSEADCTQEDDFEAENDCTQGGDEFEDDNDRTPPDTAGTETEDAAEGEFEADFEQADEEPGDDEFENETLSPHFEAPDTSNQPNPADLSESRQRSESNGDEFEDEAATLAHQVSKYDTSDCFEDDASPQADKLQKLETYGSGFEDDGYENEFEDD